MGYIGGIGGFISYDASKEVPVEIRYCMTGKNWVFEVKDGGTYGGIQGHACVGFKLTNCLSAATPMRYHSKGYFVGVCDSTKSTIFENCLGILPTGMLTVPTMKTDGDQASHRADPIFINCYGTVGSDKVTTVGRSNLIGDKAKTYLVGFDWDNVWQTVKDGTPTLRGFQDDFSQAKQKVEISFYTDGGTKVEAITGYPSEKIPWPDESSIRRDEDVFAGWYLELDHYREYPVDYFPEYDIVLFAKWEERTIKQNFEEYQYNVMGESGLGYDYERYKPGTPGYNIDNAYDELCSMHRLGLDEYAGEQDFAIFHDDYDYLDIGRLYTVTMMVKVESVGNADDCIKLVHTDSLDVFEPAFQVDSIVKLGDLKIGEWQEIKFNVKANGYYFSIRTPGMSSIYFDTIKVVPALLGATEDEFIDRVTYENSAGNNGTDNDDNTIVDENIIFVPENDESNILDDNQTTETNVPSENESTDSESNESTGSNATENNKNNSNKGDKVEESEFPWILVIAIAAGALVVISGVVLFIVLKKKKK